MPRRGVTVGKFYPPHRGHRRLIETARARCDELHVLVGARPSEDPPASLRVEWLRRMHPDVTFVVVEDTYPEDPQIWADVAIRELGFTPDVALTGEDYGAAWARYIGCSFELVDRSTRESGCQGRLIRADPLRYWDCIDPIVRGHYAARVAVVGAESTGTTTLAMDLAAHYQTVWVPEYGRDYYEDRVRRGEGEQPWTTAEFVHIAQRQAQLEDKGATAADRVLFCDTDPMATEIWHERYVGSRSEEVAAVAAARHYDLYVLTAPDIPFVQDGFRDGEHIRDWMHRRFVVELTSRQKHHIVVEGGRETRVRTAIEAVDEVLGLCRLYRPVGPEELRLIEETDWRAYPPRLDWQPIFYPVLNFEYAEPIARDWNVRDSDFGAVTSCWVRRAFFSQHEVHQVGGATVREYWIPAEELDTFNKNIVGRVEVAKTYSRVRDAVD